MNSLALDDARGAAPAAAPLTTRLANVIRLHVANPWPTLGLPWLILLTIFTMTFTIWHLVAVNLGGPSGVEEDTFTINGGMGFIFVYLIVVASQAMNQSFLFALGMSITRRDYYVGTLIYCASLAVYYAAGVTVLMAIERATGGWGIKGQFFQPFGITNGSIADFALGYVVAMFAMFAIGMSFGAVFARWGGTGITVAILASVAALIGAAWVIGTLDAWDTVGRIVTGAEAWGLVASVLVPVAIALTAGFAILRRTAPRA